MIFDSFSQFFVRKHNSVKPQPSLADFLRTASWPEKQAVFTEAASLANRDQKEIMNGIKQ